MNIQAVSRFDSVIFNAKSSLLFQGLVIAILAGCDSRQADLTRGVSSRCQIHGTQMIKTNVPICYGLIAFSEWGKAWKTASSNSFPNAESEALGGCLVDSTSPKRAIIYVCPQCLQARAQWELKNPAPKRYPENAIAGGWVGFDLGQVWSSTVVYKLILKDGGTGILKVTGSFDATNIYSWDVSKWYITNDSLVCELRHNGDGSTNYSRMTAALADSGTIRFNGKIKEDRGWEGTILFWHEKDLEEKEKILSKKDE